ncbi:MAG: alanine dehydrogenase [Desulfobacterales bacterium]
MQIGVLKEIKTKEHRVSVTPEGVEQMREHGHEVRVEAGAGVGSDFSNKEYENAGAIICNSPKEIYRECEMIMKVKEPLSVEYPLIQNGQVLFTYFHFAANLELTKAFMKSGAVAVAYETVEQKNGSLPLLTPMSEVAGRLAVQEGAKYLEKTYGGRGILLSGVPGVDSGVVLIIGGGIVGASAARIACGFGAKVYLLDTRPEQLRYLADIMPRNCFPIMSSPATIRRLLKEADLVVGAVLIHGAAAPKLITRDMLKIMKKGSVIVDVAIDQGGCVETAKPTTHDDPIYEVDGIIHYCVTNMPGAVSYTSTKALTNVTLPYALEIADKGYEKAAKENAEILKGINILKGKVTYKAVADAFDLKYYPVESLV